MIKFYRLQSGMCFLPPSSFTFKMAFGNGTALMLKPEERNEKSVIVMAYRKHVHVCMHMCGQHMLGVMRVNF